jgi:hypothetical protein
MPRFSSVASLSNRGIINSAEEAADPSVTYLMVAGGGGGGSYGGGGGAGGLLEGVLLSTFDENYTFTVGAGAAAINTGSTSGSNGSNSTAFGLTAIGGGGGANNGSSPTIAAAHTGLAGGSGGGAGGQNFTNYGGYIAGGLGTGGQGNRGKRSRGGGGAGAAGVDGTGASVGPGGEGRYSSISGLSVAYAGGGGGYNYASTEKASGGVGGGGAGGASGSIQGTSATANTGGGGGAGGPNSGAGGSGIIILKYSDAVTFTATAGLTATTDTSVAGFKITTVTAGTGSVTFSGVPGYFGSNTYTTHPTFGTLVATFAGPDWQPVGTVSVTEGYPKLTSSNVILSDANFQSIRAATTSNLVYYVWGASLENFVSFNRTTIESANVKPAPTTTINPNSFGYYPNSRTHWWSETTGSNLIGGDYSFMTYRDTNQLSLYTLGPVNNVSSSNAALLNSNSNITGQFYIFYK